MSRIDLKGKKEERKEKVWQRALFVPSAPNLAPNENWKSKAAFLSHLPRTSPFSGNARSHIQESHLPSHGSTCWRPESWAGRQLSLGCRANRDPPSLPPPKNTQRNRSLPLRAPAPAGCRLPTGQAKDQPRRGPCPLENGLERGTICERPLLLLKLRRQLALIPVSVLLDAPG